MIAFAPSNRRSRWRSMNAGWPPRTRSPSQTPSPRTKPESNTDTTARSRGTSSPFTQIRIRSLRGSSSKSWVPCATSVVAERAQLRSADLLERAALVRRQVLAPCAGACRADELALAALRLGDRFERSLCNELREVRARRDAEPAEDLAHAGLGVREQVLVGDPQAQLRRVRVKGSADDLLAPHPAVGTLANEVEALLGRPLVVAAVRRQPRALAGGIHLRVDDVAAVAQDPQEPR